MRFLSLLVFILFVCTHAQAQSITLSGSSTTVRDADEFFTDIWSDPKDFESTCDVGDDGYVLTNEIISSGIWTATHGSTTLPQLKIVPIPLPGLLRPYHEDCTRLGQYLPIDASKYTRLSYRNRLATTSSFSVLWGFDPNSFVINGFSASDGETLPNGFGQNPNNSWIIKDVDLPSNAPGGHAWSGSVVGLTLWPSLTQAAGNNISMDWVRLIDPSSSPTYPLSWTSTGGNVAQDGVSIYVDDNNSGYDGSFFIRGEDLNDSTNVLTGLLPPGTYYFYAQMERASGSSITVRAQSSYVGPVVVNGKPIISFTSPARTSGFEYARDELGNAWDMDSITDVFNTVSTWPQLFRGFINWTTNSGIFQASTEAIANVDTQLLFEIAANKPLDPDFYRYACYRMSVDPVHLPRDGDNTELNLAGWVARVIWVGPNGLGSTSAHGLYERSDAGNTFSTYCVDLWDSANLESGTSWQSNTNITTLRFDPLEATPETPFELDFFSLYSENHDDSSKEFDIEWDVTDPENQTLTSIQISYDSDRTGFNGTTITTLNNQTPGSGSYTWDTSGVPNGRYYIYLTVTDSAGNVAQTYSEVEVVVSATSGIPEPAGRAPCDYDGDGKTDFTIVRPSPNAATTPASWYTLNSADNSVNVVQWGNDAFDVFIDLDLQGDAASDETFVRARSLSLVEFFSLKSTDNLAATNPWGVLGDIPLTADFDGDRIDDITVYRPSTGNWWSLRSTQGFLSPVPQWGLPGDVPLPEDYDGDGLDDLAVWRPSSGNWWVSQSTNSFSSDPNDIILKQWGLFGDHAMSGDYDGDRTADLTVWRPTDGNWYTCQSSTSFNCPAQFSITQWGLPGDMPVKGDFDGDGTLDPAVWRPSNGTWYVRRSSDSGLTVQQWGLPGDWPMCTSTSNLMAFLP